MNTTGNISIVNVKTCSQCQGNTEYRCYSCQKDLCSHCKEEHIKNPQESHNVTVYWGRFYSGSKQEMCGKHPGQLFEKYCESCEIPLCLKCRSEEGHHIVDIRSAYEIKREQHSKILHQFRVKILYSMRILLSELQADVKACRRMICHRQSRIIGKAQRLKDLVGKSSKGWCMKLKICLSIQIARIQRYENKYEECVTKPVQFLRFITDSKCPQKRETSTCYLTKIFRLSLTPKFSMKDIVEFLTEIQVVGRGKRKVIKPRESKNVEYHRLLERQTLICRNFHEMNATGGGSIVNVKTCSQCQEHTEYRCHSCQMDLCSQCKEEHVINLCTKNHIVTLYREKFYSKYKEEICGKHPGQLFAKYCEPCEIPLCLKCRTEEGHHIVDIKCAYETKREQHSKIFHHFRSETLFSMRSLFSELHTDVNACKRMIYRRQSEMKVKAQKLKELVNRHFKHWRIKPKMCLLLQIVSIQRYENKHEECVAKPIRFLRFIKNSKLLSLTRKFSMVDVIDFLSKIQVIGRGKRHVVNERLLTLTPSIYFQKSFSLDIQGDHTISHFVLPVSHSDQMWVASNDRNFLVDTKTGAIVQREDSLFDTYFKQLSGKHTINGENELIYINKNLNIIKCSKYGYRTILENNTNDWQPMCVYCCPSNGDLLVGMRQLNTNLSKGKVNRYHIAKHHAKTKTRDTTEYWLPWLSVPVDWKELCAVSAIYQPCNGGWSVPNYITENSNGDVVVSCVKDTDYGAVVVAERQGRHRFTYRGREFRPSLAPTGICTDPLSNILVCFKYEDVHIIDKNGQFLIYLRTGISEPCTLEFDTNTYLLWVGDRTGNTLHNMRYLSRKGLQLKGEYPMYVLLKCVKVKDVCRHLHISSVKEKRVWVSDFINLRLADTTNGRILCNLEDMCDHPCTGLYSVNKEGELFYIDASFNITKFSMYSKSKKTFIKNATWRPLCVYCSPFTEELLVAMRNIDEDSKQDSAMIVRYDNTGKPIQILQYNNTGQDLYNFPRYITENNNGDVVVSDCYNGVVVTSREGRHRFSYTGPQSGSVLDPWGICTDALSHILVCDRYTKAIQIIDSDGQFLTFLMTNPRWNITPINLSYDVNNHLLYVGSIDSNRLYVYRDITQYTALTDYYQAFYNNTENRTQASMVVGRDIFNDVR